MTKENELIVGIDEVGRGPLAGPVTIAAFGADKKMEKWLFKNIFENKLRDSKKLSPKQRYTIYRKLSELKKQNQIFFTISHISNKIIDKKGINFAIKLGIENCLSDLTPHFVSPSPRSRRGEKREKSVFIKLDGGLKAPEKYKNQKTIIKGDEKEVFIACASIVAKVSRDRLMCRLASQEPRYAFEIHKGYGTRLHYKLLRKHGLCPLHRSSFCKKLTL